MTTQVAGYLKAFWKQIVVSFLVVVYVAINIFRIGGDTFIISLNNFIVVPFALGLAILALIVWHQIRTGSQNRLLWLGLALGWAMWTIAELWWSVAAIIGQEVPYPSPADFFWLVGYIPIYFALWVRIRSLPKVTRFMQQIGIWAFGLAFVAFVAVFILMPIIQDNDPSAIVESIINILYPLADLGMLIFVLQLLFSYQQGMYGQAWRWLTAGFILFAFGDLLFVFGDIRGMYYPEQQVNYFSSLAVDIPYNLSYLVWMIGLFLFQDLLKTFQPVAGGDHKLVLVPNTHLLVFTKGDDTVIDVSQNYAQVFPTDTVKGKTISEVLGISGDDETAITKEIKTNRTLQERAFKAVTRFGEEQILISGLIVLDLQKEYSGLTFLVRIHAADYSLDKSLTDFNMGIIRSLLASTGTGQKEQEEIKRLLADYYQAFLNSFYNRAITEGGGIMADAFITELQATARRKGWQIEIQPNSGIDIRGLTLSEAQNALPTLYETARQFIIKLADEGSVNKIIEDVRSKFSAAELQNISQVDRAKHNTV